MAEYKWPACTIETKWLRFSKWTESPTIRARETHLRTAHTQTICSVYSQKSPGVNWTIWVRVNCLPRLNSPAVLRLAVVNSTNSHDLFIRFTDTTFTFWCLLVTILLWNFPYFKFLFILLYSNCSAEEYKRRFLRVIAVCSGSLWLTRRLHCRWNCSAAFHWEKENKKIICFPLDIYHPSQLSHNLLAAATTIWKSLHTRFSIRRLCRDKHIYST